ncbi:MAG: RecB family exonuclease [Armatimonadota bacterium]
MPSKAPRKPPVPKLPRFSPTRLNLYRFCPRAYYFYYVRRLRWGGITAGHAFGGHLHRSLQVFHERGGLDSVSLEELVSDLRSRWSAAGFADPQEAQAHLEAGEEVLRRYYSAAAEPGRETLWTERTVQHRYDDFVLFGKVDRLDRRPDGGLEVVDYKSGRLSVCEEEVRESLALLVYQLLVARAHPGMPVYAGILCLRSGAAAAVLRTPEELDAAEAEIQELVRTILADERMAPIPGEQCRECVYPRICPPGRRWLETSRKTEDGR